MPRSMDHAPEAVRVKPAIAAISGAVDPPLWMLDGALRLEVGEARECRGVDQPKRRKSTAWPRTRRGRQELFAILVRGVLLRCLPRTRDVGGDQLLSLHRIRHERAFVMRKLPVEGVESHPGTVGSSDPHAQLGTDPTTSSCQPPGPDSGDDPDRRQCLTPPRPRRRRSRHTTSVSSVVGRLTSRRGHGARAPPAVRIPIAVDCVAPTRCTSLRIVHPWSGA